MNRLAVSALRPGIVLGRDLYSYSGQLLLPKGTTLTQAHLDYFRDKKIDSVYIYDNSKPRSTDEFSVVYDSSVHTVKAFMLEAKLGRALLEEEVLPTVDTLVEQVFDEGDLFRQMRMMKEKDDYLFVHSINVALLSILVGRWLKLDREEVQNLGTAGFLHDIGKVKVPNDILNKPGSLSEEEFFLMQQHTKHGYEMVKDWDWVTPEIADAVLSHHERLDGSGYPSHHNGDQIGLFARIVAVADVYDAITSSRTYANKRSPYSAAEILWEESFGKLDARATKVFFDRVANFYIGNKVRLSNQEIGMVVFIPVNAPTRPMVQVGEKFYNLNENRNLSIIEVID
ncbi:MAG: HD-GYP domain-containing protein [Methanomassiliicoccales archaeon]